MRRTAAERPFGSTQNGNHSFFLARNNTADADIALSEIIANAEAAKPHYLGSLAVTALDWTIGHAVGAARAAIAKDRGLSGDQWDREVLANGNTVDAEGALGDYLTQTLLGKSGAKMAPLVEWRAFGALADLEATRLAIDVKTAGEPRANVAINCAAHYKKSANAYLVVKFARSDVVDLFVVKAAPEELKWYKMVPRNGKPPFWILPLPKMETLDELESA